MWIPGMILVLLLLVNLLPVGLKVLYHEEGLLLYVRLGLIRIRILPKREKHRRQRTSRKASSKGPKEKQGLADRLKGGSLDLLKDLLPAVSDFVGGLRQKLVVDELELCAWVGGTDPCTIGVNYGCAWAAMGSLAAVLENIFTIRRRDLRAEFSSDEAPITISASMTLHLHLYQALALCNRCGLRVVRVYLNRQKQKRAAKLTA